jgi:hypothetical protein
MKQFVLGALIASAISALSFVSPASALASRTWVSGTGIDTNPCTRASPCATFAHALAATAAGGVINCVDSGEYYTGTLFITKSVSIICVGAAAGVTAGGAIVSINISVASTDVVTLEGLDLQGVQGGYGIDVAGGGTVVIQKCRIIGYNSALSSGIVVEPTSGLARVFIDDSTIINNGSATSSAGILVKPTGGASANVSVTNVKLEGNTNGIFFDGSGGAGPSNIDVFSSNLTGNQVNGIAVASSSAAVNAVVIDSLLNLNVNTGAGIAGSGATLRLDGNAIVSNITGVFNSGGTLQSLKNNTILANGSDGTPVPAYPGPGGTPLQ